MNIMALFLKNTIIKLIVKANKRKGCDDNMAEKQKKLKTIIVVLLILLILSAVALVVMVYLNFSADKSDTTIVPDNLINQETTSSGVISSQSNNNEQNTETSSVNVSLKNAKKTTTIDLYKGKASDNGEFEVKNMLPGDTEVKYFAVKVSHHADVIVYFNAEVTYQIKNLADVLNIKVTNLKNNKVIYDGSFADIGTYGETFTTMENTETVVYYKIEVSLPTSTGNEYQDARLMAEFNWYVKDADALDSPQTSDNSSIMLHFVIMCSSFAMLIVLLLFRCNKKEDVNAESK